MRDTAGSAAAPAARWRKFRRGSFILNLPSHHSITSSARASTAGGISRPRAYGAVGIAPLARAVRVKLESGEIAALETRVVARHLGDIHAGEVHHAELQQPQHG